MRVYLLKKLKTLWQKEKLLVLSNFFFCYNVSKKLSAADRLESVYMRERVKVTFNHINPLPHTTAADDFENIYVNTLI